MNKSHQNLPPEALPAWISVIQIYNLCIDVLAVKLNDIGFTVAQYEALTHLQRTPGISQQDLASRCFVTKSGMSMLLKKLESDQWITRVADVADARSKRLSLTLLGHKQVKKMMPVQADVVAAMATCLSHQELKLLLDMMNRISLGLREL